MTSSSSHIFHQAQLTSKNNQYLVVGKTTVEVKGNKKDSINWFELIIYIIEEYGKKHN